MIHDIGDVRLNVVELGRGDLSLVFLHDCGGSARTWRLVTHQLAGQFRTVAVDLRGCGESDKPAAGYRVERLADDVEALVAALGLGRYVLVGHSMGGKVAQLLASRRSAGLEALVLVAPAPLSPRLLTDAQLEAVRRAGDGREGLEAALPLLVAAALPADLREQVVEDGLATAAGLRSAWVDTMLAQDFTADAAMIAVPTLVLVGESDTVGPPESVGREVVGRVAGAVLKVIARSGHLVPLEAPQRVADEIERFLRPPKPAPVSKATEEPLLEAVASATRASTPEANAG